LSASHRVGRTVVLVLGEDVSKWDDFGKIPGARFEIIEHNGSWAEIISAVEDAKDEAAKAIANGEPPFVFTFDTITAEWEGHKDWAAWRARNTQKARERLARDPNVEIDVSGNFWNDARARHRQLMSHLLTFPGIVVLIARGSEVTLYRDGKPVANQTTWSVESEKNLPFDVSAHVRMRRKGNAELVSAAGVNSPVRPGDDKPYSLPRGWKLESLVFDILGLDTAKAAAGGVIDMQTSELTPEQILEEARRPDTTFARIKELHAEMGNLRYDGVILANERGQEEQLLDQIVRIGKAKLQAEQRAAEERASQAREQALAALGPDDSWLMPISNLATLADEEALRAEFMDAFGSKPDDDPRKKALLALLNLKRADLSRAAAPAGKAAA
jgi:hypothetical protein